MLDQHNEIQEALGRTYGVPDVDEAELEAGKELGFLMAFFQLPTCNDFSRRTRSPW